VERLPQEPVVVLRRRGRGLSPAQLIVVSFAAAIAAGTVLLRLPLAHGTGVEIGWIDALFTATSAVCVTGLAVVDTGRDWSPFGQAIILLLNQVGGLGILTVGSLLALVTGRRLGFRHRLQLQTQLNALQVGGVVRLVRRIVLVVLGIELLGALALYVRFAAVEGWGPGAWQALFHSVSAFNNAGFSLYPDSLERFVADPVVNLAVIVLVVLGGLGFVVVVNLIARYRQQQRTPLSLHTKLALTATAWLIGTATVVLLLLEWTNPATLGELSWPTRAQAALFQAVTPRTAGFNTVSYAAMSEASLMFTMLLMFIGGNPGSTAGGIKTVTFFVLVGSAWSISRGRGELHLFNRRVPLEIAVRAGVITLTSFMVIALALTLLAITDAERGMLALAFETVSAFGTVGLSMGATPDLSAPGKIIVALLMFIGRLGPLTMALALVERPVIERIEYPAEEVAPSSACGSATASACRRSRSTGRARSRSARARTSTSSPATTSC
jgi:trk system potassium uptake protein TrkH